MTSVIRKFPQRSPKDRAKCLHVMRW